MKRVRLRFRGSADVWNYLVLARIKGVEVEGSTVTGYFTKREIELACQQFWAEIKGTALIQIDLGNSPNDPTGF